MNYINKKYENLALKSIEEIIILGRISYLRYLIDTNKKKRKNSK